MIPVFRECEVARRKLPCQQQDRFPIDREGANEEGAALLTCGIGEAITAL